uniref:Putative secreted protein n=1 Tax=Ornithodoros turicata TaxID=34597 RepID=A0A2R5LN97_9ACAR
MHISNSFLHPYRVVLAAVHVWCVLFFLALYQHYLMASFYLTVIAVALLCYTVKKAAIPQIDDDTANQVIFGGNISNIPIFAHRGGAHDAPENTLAAFREAKRNNATGIEFDLSFTHDSIAVLFHDDTLDRTTNGTGYLAKQLFNAVRQLDASSYHPYGDQFRGEKIPTVEEGVEECLKLGMRIIFDVKEFDYRAVTVIDDLYRKHPDLYKTALVASFFPQFIYTLRLRNPNIVTALTWRPGFVTYEDIEMRKPRFNSLWKHLGALALDWFLDWSLHNWMWYVMGNSGVLICKNVLSAEYVNMWKERGIHVIAWTPNHPTEKDFLLKVLRVPIITDSLR